MPKKDKLMDEVPPQIKYAQPGAYDHDKPKSWFSMHHVLAYLLVGLFGMAIVLGVLYYQVSKNIPNYQAPVHQTKSTDSMADWETYTSEAYGFEIKYPSKYTVRERDYAVDIAGVRGAADYPGVFIRMHENPKLQNINQWWENFEEKKDYPNTPVVATKFDIYEGLRLNNSTDEITLFVYKDKVYQIIVVNKLKDSELILSTFKFIGSVLPKEITDNAAYKAWVYEKGQAYDFDASTLTEPKKVTLNIETVVPTGTNTCKPVSSGDKSIASPTKIRTACIYSGGEPDSYLYIMNSKTLKTSTIKTCGTICTFENGFWLDDNNFVLLETDLDMDYSDNRFDIYTFNVIKYDFAKFETTTWQSTLRIER